MYFNIARTFWKGVCDDVVYLIDDTNTVQCGESDRSEIIDKILEPRQSKPSLKTITLNSQQSVKHQLKELELCSSWLRSDFDKS